MKRSLRVWLLCIGLSGGLQPLTSALPAQIPGAQGAETNSTAKPSRSDAAEPPYSADPKFQAALASARQAMHDRTLRSDDRLSRWKKANKLAGNECTECLNEIAMQQVVQQDWKNAVATATQWSALATSTADKILSGYLRGSCLLQYNGGHPKPDTLRDADLTFREVLKIAPRNRRTLFDEGRVLAMEGQDDEAKSMFVRYLEAGKPDQYSARAKHFSENPHLATMPMAPPFTVTTAQGERISLDEQVGKVVLLDFWATWCGPCKQTLPEIHNIAKKFAGQPLLVVSISSDHDEAAWKDFVAKNDMFWTQYRDSTGELSRAYGVNAIPRFFTIDSDGVLESVRVGSDADVEGNLKKLVKRAAEDAGRKAALTDAASAP